MKTVRLCKICDNSGWICENHPDRPWSGFSDRSDACGCGAGATCPVCYPADADHQPDLSRTEMVIDVVIDPSLSYRRPEPRRTPMRGISR